MKLITTEGRDWTSSLIKHTEYNPDDKQLSVTFQNGKDYLYYDVTEEDYQSFCSAESQGSYFGKNIRGKKDFSIILESGEITEITKVIQNAKNGNNPSI
jgi:hypothetical protein